MKDSRVIYIGKIIHDIEINVWDKKVYEDTILVQDAVTAIVSNAGSHDEIILQCCNYFDDLYQSMQSSDGVPAVGNE